MVLRCFILLLLISFVVAIPVDNGVEGDPEIECGATSITVNFNTQATFGGHVYVKGLYAEPGCRNDENGRQVAGITLPFETCNLARTRSLNPRGIFVTTTIVITFHPSFITKVDRAYRIQCFYMEADKTVSAELAVSDLTTAFYTQLVPMPICRYEILLNGPEGEPITFAEIGQQVYHKWTCDTETTDTFCMVVHSCFVDDGNGDVVNILNDDGCALDRYILNNLEYPGDLMAGQEAHVYKYADRSQLFYQCQITITIKEPGGDCPRPQCQEPTGTATGGGATRTNELVAAAGALRQQTSNDSSTTTSTQPTSSTTIAAITANERRLSRRVPQLGRVKREADWRHTAAGTMDVRTELNALDIVEQDAGMQQLNNHRRRHLSTEPFSHPQIADDTLCMEKKILLIAIAAPGSLIAVVGLSSYYVLSQRLNRRVKPIA